MKRSEEKVRTANKYIKSLILGYESVHTVDSVVVFTMIIMYYVDVEIPVERCINRFFLIWFNPNLSYKGGYQMFESDFAKKEFILKDNVVFYTWKKHKEVVVAESR